MDVYSPEKRSAVMRRVKGRNTGPELAVRRILRRAGIGYRLGGCGLPGNSQQISATSAAPFSQPSTGVCSSKYGR